jgi:hypothetical protein
VGGRSPLLRTPPPPSDTTPRTFEDFLVRRFTPLGDPDGLLIVVRRGRVWFPTTTVTPSLGPIAVTVELPNGGKSLALTSEPHGQVGVTGFVGVSVSIPFAHGIVGLSVGGPSIIGVSRARRDGGQCG